MTMWRLKTAAPVIVVAVAALCIITLRMAYARLGPPLLVNYTDSEPKGLYWLQSPPRGPYHRGQTVAFPVPEPFRDLVAERRWLAAGLPLMKGIAALEGDVVCTNAREASINGQSIGPIFVVDSAGRPLPEIRGCYTIAPGYFLPFSDVVPRSFDGRYLGPQPLSAILGEVHSVWIF
jgi:conjugative transfer signal peptidase TraF